MKIDPPAERKEEADYNRDIDNSLYCQEDPVAILSAHYRMATDRKRAAYAFDHADLNTLSLAWERAAVAGCGDLEFLREKERYRILCNELKNGMAEHKQEFALMFLESRDWTKPRLILRAIERLQHAQINTVH